MALLSPNLYAFPADSELPSQDFAYQIDAQDRSYASWLSRRPRWCDMPDWDEEMAIEAAAEKAEHDDVFKTDSEEEADLPGPANKEAKEQRSKKQTEKTRKEEADLPGPAKKEAKKQRSKKQTEKTRKAAAAELDHIVTGRFHTNAKRMCHVAGEVRRKWDIANPGRCYPCPFFHLFQSSAVDVLFHWQIIHSWRYLSAGRSCSSRQQRRLVSVAGLIYLRPRISDCRVPGICGRVTPR